jgi:LuxR family transcriptional regulator, maltose regulon positive regulatory protein
MDTRLGLQKEIFPVKLSRPRLQPTCPRNRLFAILRESVGTCAIWICGPAGSGKTTLVNSFLDTTDIPCIWYGVDPTDTDIASFFYYMSNAWKKISSDAAFSLPFFTQEFFPKISIFTNRFFNLFSQHIPRPLAIVLDNYQAAGEEAQLHDVLCSAIDILQGKISIIICSRTEPPAAFARARANRALRVLNWHHLQFQKKEVKEVIQYITGSTYPNNVISDLHQKTDGWIAGLLLVLLKKQANDDMEPHLLVQQTPEEIFDYLGTTIFNNLDPEIQTILVKLSYLPRISLSAAQTLGGKLACSVLETLIRKNRFTFVSMNNSPEYHFHPLFQEFLQKKAHVCFSNSEHNELLLQTASILAEEGKSEDAITLYLGSRHFMKAMGLILDRAPILVSQGRVQTIETWINAFPQDVFMTNPWLIFWKGTCKIPTAPDQAKTLFQKALAIFETQSDPAGCFLSLSGILDAITFQFNIFQEMDPYFEKCRLFEARFGLVGPPEVILRITASMLNALVLRRPDSEDTKKWSERGWQVLHMTKDVNLTLQIFSPLIILRIMQGDLFAAEHLLQVFKKVSHKKASPLSYIVFQDLKSFHAWLSGNFQKGLTAARQAMAIERETGVSLIFLPLRVHAAASAIGLGRYDRARKLLEEVTPFLDHQGLWNQCLYHNIFFWLNLVTENFSECRHHAKAFFEKGTQAGNRMILTSAHLSMAKMFYAFGEKQNAEMHLKQSFHFCSRYGTIQDKFMALLTLAIFFLDKQADTRATKVLRKALYLGRIWNYRYGFFWVPKEMARLFSHALKNDIEVKYVRTLIREHNLIPERPPLNIANWPWPIRIYSFGGLQIYLGENVLQFSRKAQQKPMTILKYMMAKPGTNVPEHALLDAVWPHSDGDAAYNTFKITLHRLRKMLGSKNAIAHKQGALAFNAFIVWTDNLALKSCCSRIDKDLEEQNCVETALQLLNELLLLYRGPFLPEEQSSWVIPEREKLRSKFLSAIKKIADQLEHQGQLEQAINCCRQALEVDPLLESLYPRIMQNYVQLGKKTEALGIYRQCKAVLQAELGASPPEKMQILKQALHQTQAPKLDLNKRGKYQRRCP